MEHFRLYPSRDAPAAFMRLNVQIKTTLAIVAATLLGLAPCARSAPKTVGQIPIWKTITLGTYRNVNVLREALASTHCGVGYGTVEVAGRSLPTVDSEALNAPPCRLGDWASGIIGRPAFTLSKIKVDVDLAVLSVFELGLTEGKDASLKDIYARAEFLGLALCPAEVGPQLRLQYLDQPFKESLHIAMQPIAKYDGQLVGFDVANFGAGLVLIGGDGRADVAVHSSVRFVFVHPRRGEPR
jgi:hypothetical protein